MIIERIKVENFASYRSVELPLRELGRTVLVHGITGAGKTTLLIDAITCALFGRAYGQLKPASKKWVIPPRRGEAKVEVDFSLGDKTFRVRRIIRENRPDSAELLKLENGREERLATGSETVEKHACKLLGLDYLTFLNTVVVRQGEVDKLLSANPQERRDVFLGAFAPDFSKYRERAKEKGTEVEQQLTKAQEREKTLSQQVEQEAEVRRMLEEARNKFRKALEDIKEAQANHKRIRLDLQQLRKKEQKLQGKLSKLEEKITQMQRLEEDLLNARKEASKLEQTKGKLSEIEEKKWNLRDEINKFSSMKSLVIRLSSIQERLDQDQGRAQKLARDVQKLPRLRKELRDAERASKHLPGLEEKLRHMRDRLKQTIQALSESKGSLKRLKNATLILQEAQVTGAEKCPVCNRPLKPDEAKAAQEYLKLEKKELEAQIKKLHRVEERLRTSSEKLEGLVNRMREENAKLGPLKNQVTEGMSRRKELNGLRRELKRMERERDKLKARVEEVLGKLLTEKEIEHLTRELKRRETQCDKEISEIKKKLGELKAIGVSIKKMKKELLKLNKVTEKVKPIQVAIQRISEERGEKERVEKSISDTLGEHRERLGEAREERNNLIKQLKEIAKAKKELGGLKQRISKLELFKRVYGYLYSNVFHDRGLPLFVIRRMIGEVEGLAKDYLRRLLPTFDISVNTDEQGHVAIEVFDGQKTRPLETYSGGERTLLGFVVRLAIARAMISGIKTFPPKCLLVDEGFGPLSANFRHDVVHALTELSDEFEQIVVISHLEDIQEHAVFGSRIWVYKDVEGTSHIQVKG